MAELVSVDHEKLHILMFPWLAFGHMIPYLELAKRIALKGHRVSFLSTPRNIDRLPKIPPSLSSALIEFVRIPLPTVDGLPDDAEATTDLPYDKVPYLKKAFDLLLEPVKRHLSSSAPDWVIYDFAPYWVGSIARDLGIKTAQFTIFMAASLVFFGPTWATKGGDYRKSPEDFTVAPNWVPFQSNIGLPYFSLKKILDDTIHENVSGVSDFYRWGAGNEGADIIAVRSSYEFEPQWLKLLEELLQKPVIPVGLLPPSGDNAGEETEAWLRIKRWLDSQENGSVVYVAFGSEAKPSQRELTEIATGLEKSALPFFWALRTQLGSSDKDRIELPDGFEERTKGRGIVWTTWAPQIGILGHGSVGGFLTHAGYSSVVEGLGFGRALVPLSFQSDTGLIVRVLEEKKMGYAVPRNEFDGSFTSEAVAKSLRLVMVEEEGKVYRDKAKEMKQVFGNQQLQETYVDNLLSHLKANRPTSRES